MLTPFKQELADTGEVTLTVRVKARAPRTEVKDVLDDGSIKIQVGAVPVAGKANRELLSFLAKEFGVPLGHVELLCGDHVGVKMIRITEA